MTLKKETTICPLCLESLQKKQNRIDYVQSGLLKTRQNDHLNHHNTEDMLNKFLPLPAAWYGANRS